MEPACRGRLALALIIVAVVIMVLYAASSREKFRGLAPKLTVFPATGRKFIPLAPLNGDLVDDPTDAIMVGCNPKALGGGAFPCQRTGVDDAWKHMYSAAEVDPLIAGQAYAYRDGLRDVYTGRTSYIGYDNGLQQFSSSGNEGDPGWDVGPFDLAAYEGSALSFNDGIPEQWAFPSTPFRWYTPPKVPGNREDHLDPGLGYGVPTLGAKKPLYPVYVQDNDPLVGEDEWVTGGP